MKIYLFLICLCFNFFLLGCKDSDIIIDKAVDAAKADAWAALTTYAFLTETCPYCSATPAGAAGVTGVVSVVAADESARAANLYKFPNNTSGNIFIDSSLISTYNPFEIVGRNHNAALNKISKNNNYDLLSIDFLQYDLSTWRMVMTDMINIDEDSTYNLAKSADVINNVRSQLHQIVTDSLNNVDDYLEISPLNPDNRSKAKIIFWNYEKFLHNNDNGHTAIVYLQDELNKILREEKGYTYQENLMIVLLTVLKWSTFYWAN